MGFLPVLLLVPLCCCSPAEALMGWIISSPKQHILKTSSARSSGVGVIQVCRMSATISAENQGSPESESDLRMRRFWETQSFHFAKDLVRRVLVNATTSSIDIDDEAGVDMGFFGFAQLRQHEPNTDSGPIVTSKPKRPSFRLDLAYDGSHFCGWQRQPAELKPSVQGVIEDAASEALRLPSADVRVSGRTDAGVHAVGQVARLRVSANVTALDVKEAMDKAARLDNFAKWRCLSVRAASEKFHPTFDTKARSYVYLIDVNETLKELCRKQHEEGSDGQNDACRLECVVERLDQILKSLEGRELDYLSFSYGRVKTEDTFCLLQHARARLVASRAALVIEVRGNRFLRRMVRILVATALQLVIFEGDDNDESSSNDSDESSRLVQMCEARDRVQTSKAAPPEGLIFVGATL